MDPNFSLTDEQIRFYNVTDKPLPNFRRQLKSMGDPIQIMNFLSADEVKLIIDLEKKRPDHKREIRPPDERMTFTEGPWEDDPRALFMKERLHRLLGPFDIWGGNYFDVGCPYLPHIDNGMGRTAPSFKNIVFPLWKDSEQTETFLVLFKQRYFGDSTGFYRAGGYPGAKMTANYALEDYSHILFLEEHHQIDPAFLKEKLSHVRPENLKGFSVEHVIPWKIGSVIAFDSSQIHCATNFRGEGIKRKLGLSLFTSLPEEA